ncbi:hypothetical protein HKX48_003174 [Thoreauomyces humboldtii]|nr:hypothetical protein HKX48_003174 [Thoreauomyces humboldtii]
MTRATRTLLTSVLSLIVWVFARSATSADPTGPWARTITAFPLWVVVTFGAYSLGTIGWALITFGDCPAAHASLLLDIQAAKSDLRAKHVTVD